MAEDAKSVAPIDSTSPTKLVAIIIVGAIVLVLASTGGIFFLLKSMGMLNVGGGGGGVPGMSQHAPPEGPAIYHAFEPAFVVNFKEKGRTRYLQINVQVMTRDEDVIKTLDQHMPLIRNNLLLLFSGKDADTLHSPEGKEKLRQAALEEVQRILEEQTGNPGVEALYFTNFVTQ